MRPYDIRQLIGEYVRMDGQGWDRFYVTGDGQLYMMSLGGNAPLLPTGNQKQLQCFYMMSLKSSLFILAYNSVGVPLECSNSL